MPVSNVVCRVLSILGFCLLGMCMTDIPAAESAVDGWPQFLGPNRNGLSDETNLIDRFGPQGPRIVWRVPGGGGMSGIAIEGTLAVTLVERDQSQLVVALNASDGTERWSRRIADEFRNAMGAGPRATPSIADGRIFVYTGEGILAALDRNTGAVQWQHNVLTELGGEPAEYGMACSPLVVDGLVVVVTGIEGASVVGYQAESGRLAWKSGNDSAGYSSPAVLTVGGRRQLVVFTGESAVGLEPGTGEQLWRYEYVTDFDCNIATPLEVANDVFISSGENHGCARLSLRQKDDVFDVSEVWTSFGPTSVMRNEWQTSVLRDGFLYGLDNVGGAGPITNLNCVNAETGERVWQQPRFGKGNLIAADGKLYIVTIDGSLVIVRATPERFEELSRARFFQGTRQVPALVDGRLYLRDSQEIICVDIRASE